MNSITKLKACIASTHPEAVLTLDEPLRQDGIWSLDVDLVGKHLVIEWSADNGFGISRLANDGFGEGADEKLATVEQVQKRVVRLLTTNELPTPPMPILLTRLREERGLTQVVLAARMGVRQSTISGIERRDDVQFSTLRRVIEALGGKLEILASFPDASYRINGAPFDMPNAADFKENLLDQTNEVVRGSSEQFTKVENPAITTAPSSSRFYPTD